MPSNVAMTEALSIGDVKRIVRSAHERKMLQYQNIEEIDRVWPDEGGCSAFETPFSAVDRALGLRHDLCPCQRSDEVSSFLLQLETAHSELLNGLLQEQDVRWIERKFVSMLGVDQVGRPGSYFAS